MKGTALKLSVLLAIAAGVAQAGEEKRRDRDERTFDALKSRASRLPKPAGGDQLGAFLFRETQRLIAESSALPRGSYKCKRLMEALDDLLDAREDFIDARHDRDEEKRKDKRDDTARRLERAYFRVQQGDYFGRLSGDAQASEYITRSRQLYQQARSAYDQQHYRRATKLASASSELVNVLENLAQAAVRKPEPPVLK